MKKSSVQQIIKERVHSKYGIRFIDITGSENFLTYGEIANESRRLLYNLHCNGVKEGAQVVLQQVNSQKFICTVWACMMGRLTAVPMNVIDNEEKALRMKKVLSTLERPVLIYDCSMNETILNLVEKHFNYDSLDKDGFADILEGKPDDIAFIQYSSGSTGNPKGVILTHENVITAITELACNIEIMETDIALTWMPLTHIFGLMGFHFTPLVGGCDQIHMDVRLFLKRPETWLELMSKHKVTLTGAPTFGLRHTINCAQEVEGLDLSSIRLLCCSAESIAPATCHLLMEKYKKTGLRIETIFPVYGMTEAALGITSGRLNRGLADISIDRRHLNIGQQIHISEDEESEFTLSIVFNGEPIGGCQVRICDDEQNVLGEGVVGYIQIKGENVFQGYYADEELSKQCFTSDGWFKTGDIGFFYNQQLAVTGREKDILILNGENFYVHDVERCIVETEKLQVKNAAVISVLDNDSNEKTFAFIETAEPLELFVNKIEAIRNTLNSKLGILLDYVLPISKMPKTESGKIKRYVLIEMYENGDFKDKLKEIEECTCEEVESCSIEECNDEIKLKLQKICQEVLDKQKINYNITLVENGADSIKSALFANRIDKEFDVNISIIEILRGCTLDEIVNQIRSKRNEAKVGLHHEPEREYYPLSFEQLRIFTASRVDNEENYLISCALKLIGNVSIKEIEDAFKFIIARHEAFRTTFHLLDGMPVQKVHKEVEFALGHEKVMPGEELEERINASISILDLEHAPLMRAKVLEIQDDYRILVINMHHIISDGTSVANVIQEMISYLRKEELAQVEYHYTDYVIWQQEFGVKELQKKERFWMNKYSGEFENLNMPLDYPRTKDRKYMGSKIRFTVNRELTDKIREICVDYKVTLFAYLFSTYGILLQKYSGQDEVVVGTTVAGRSLHELSGNIGMFVNFLPIKLTMDCQTTVHEQIDKNYSDMLDYFENQEYPFNMLVNKLQISKQDGRNPMFDTVFQLRNFCLPRYECETLQIEEYEFDNHIAMYDFKLEIVEEEDELRCVLEYSNELYEKETMQEFSEKYLYILQQMIENDDRKLGEIKLLSEEEKQQREDQSLNPSDVIQFNFD